MPPWYRLLGSGVRPRTAFAPWIVLAIVGLSALFVASALLPPFALVVVMMLILAAAFGIVAWRSPGGS
jgi:hypothetical protein